MQRSYAAMVLGATLLRLGACTTATFTSTWKEPDGQAINPAGNTSPASEVRPLVAQCWRF
jgi:hypothetical protein